MSLSLTLHEKAYLKEICQQWIDDWRGVEQDAPRLYATACKVIDWVEEDA